MGFNPITAFSLDKVIKHQCPHIHLSRSGKVFRAEQREIEVLQTQSDQVFIRGTLQIAIALLLLIITAS